MESTTLRPINGAVQQMIGTPDFEEHRQGTITPTPSELVDSPTNRQMLRNGSQSPDFGGFKPHQISNLVASFIPLFETDDPKNLKSKPLATGEYEEIGMHLLQTFGGMLNEQRSHFLPLLGGLLIATITTLDVEILKHDKTSESLHEAIKVAKLVATRTSASPSIRQQLWQPPDHLEPELIKRVTDTAKRTQLYLELNALAMNRITPLLTERALAFSHRANVRPVPLSKNERSFFFQLMAVFPLHGSEKELNERIAQWIAALPLGIKRLRSGQEHVSKMLTNTPCAEVENRPKVKFKLASPEKRQRLGDENDPGDMTGFENLTLASLRKLLISIGNITGSGKCLPWTAVSALAPCDTMLPDDPAQVTVDALRVSLNKLGLNEETKDSPGL